MKENTLSVTILVAISVGAAAIVGGYQLGRHIGFKNGYNASQKVLDDKLRTEKSRKDDLLFKLRVCINNASNTDAQTSCFRLAEKGILPQPNIKDMNSLPNLY